MWEQCGIKAANASDSQALIQLKKEYCDKKEMPVLQDWI